jgi:hypothetical protein
MIRILLCPLLSLLAFTSTCAFATSEFNNVSVSGHIFNQSGESLTLVSGSRADANFPTAIKKQNHEVEYGFSIPVDGSWSTPIIYQTSSGHRCYFQFRALKQTGATEVAVMTLLKDDSANTKGFVCRAAGTLLSVGH